MGEKFKNRAKNTAKLPGRLVGTVGLLAADSIKTGAGYLQDAGSVIINTTNKIVDLFSDDLKRYQKTLNVPVAIGVGADGVFETILKPVVNAGGNALKTVANLGINGINAFRNVFSTRPTKMSYNTIKRGKKEIKLSTESRLRDPKRLLTEGVGFLTRERKISDLERKRNELMERDKKLEKKLEQLRSAA